MDRLFAKLFDGLVYAQIWEDPEVDAEALQLGRSSRIVAIASGGCNVMSYAAANPSRILAVDLNPAHVALLKLKVADVPADLLDFDAYQAKIADEAH